MATVAGDEILFHHVSGRWLSAEVLAVTSPGVLSILFDYQVPTAARGVTHGAHLTGWLTYEEAASGATVTANA